MRPSTAVHKKFNTNPRTDESKVHFALETRGTKGLLINEIQRDLVMFVCFQGEG